MARTPIKITKKLAEKYASALTRAKGNRVEAAKTLGVDVTNYRRWLSVIEEKYPEIKLHGPVDLKAVKRVTAISDEELHECWAVYERYGYNESDAAEAIGMNRKTFGERIKAAMFRLHYQVKSLGVEHAKQAKAAALPKKGQVKYVICMSAQNNTKVWLPGWKAIVNYGNFLEAEFKIGTITYAATNDGSAKRGKEKDTFGHKVADRWYDPLIVPFICDEYEELAPGLVWCGHHNILPTAADPLQRTENMNGRNSGIFPHTRQEMRPIATAGGDDTKFNFTTGAITLRNYKQAKAGIVAEFYHTFGAMLIEIDSDGNWWPRQLNVDSEGRLYDINVYADGDGVWAIEEGDVEAITFGDIHRANIDEGIREATWGSGGVVEVLQPKIQVFPDLLDFESRSHHNRRDPHVMYALWKHGRDGVLSEIKQAAEFLDEAQAAAPASKLYVQDSNHDRHLDRWLRETTPFQDLPNARIWMQITDALLDHIDNGEEFLPFEWACKFSGLQSDVVFLNNHSDDPDKLSLVVCKGEGGGIELGLHGDQGVNGARGGPRSLSKLGRKNVIAHSHSPGIWGGTFVAGVTGKKRQGYNAGGASSWAHAHVVTYRNGKRQILLAINNKFWAPR